MPVPKSSSTPQLTTAGAIAVELGEPIHRVLHVLNTRPAIRPAARAGRVRLFDRAAVLMVRAELHAIDEWRARTGGAR
jgi:hypothetical protein